LINKLQGLGADLKNKHDQKNDTSFIDDQIRRLDRFVRDASKGLEDVSSAKVKRTVLGRTAACLSEQWTRTDNSSTGSCVLPLRQIPLCGPLRAHARLRLLAAAAMKDRKEGTMSLMSAPAPAATLTI